MKHRAGPPLRVAVVSLAIVWLPVVASPVSVSAQVQIDSRAMELTVSGRVQFQAQTSSCGDGPPDPASACDTRAPELDMFLRRARLGIVATIDERLTFKLEPDFSDIDEVALKDAWGRYAFSPTLALKAGHFNRPFDGFYLTPSSHLPFERVVMVPGVPAGALPSFSGLTKAAGLSDRDIGLTLEGAHDVGRFAWSLGVFTGGSASRARDTNSEKQFVGRVRYELDAGGAPLGIAGALALSDAPYVGTDGGSEAEYYSNFELFAELGAWDRDGLLVQAGVVAGANPSVSELGLPIDLGAGDEFADLLTWQGVAAYRIAVPDADWLDAVTPSLRVSYADPTDLDDDEVLTFTPGIAFNFHGRNRLVVTWDVARFADDGVRSESSLKSHLQFLF